MLAATTSSVLMRQLIDVVRICQRSMYFLLV